MDLSALIFVALAVAWVVYLVPKALRHHEEDAVSRSVDRFSDRLRVLARRDAVSAREAELVTSDAPVADAPAEAEAAAEPVAEPVAEPAAPTPAPRAVRSPVARRAAARRAAQRRRRVLGTLVLLTLVVAGLAVGGVIATPWIAAPLTLLAAWLVACRLMVRNERAARAAATAPARRRRRTLADEELAAEDAAASDTAPEPDLPAEPGGVVAELADDDTGEIPAITAEVADGWTPVAVPLPTYVAKAPAGRTVRTIDLDATGVWSSGRNEADSQLAREADAQRADAAAAAATDADERRATGS
ncbi:divisome protein SepX/GlpR [Pimelobacter simplex]|uniref:divisome protein SepX/GlpR n=1 Tax=Nocardioides simplex TaxID=2045 RepID=UPI0021503649|nr:hypothetical protein [Pimelobacter simplex]UUW91914.1 hypothetical protein M0M43_10660 [Pimelobacter simplex]UUW95741.1 hypothetical protein M0M48_29160 [Pimelobacter simplex]